MAGFDFLDPRARAVLNLAVDEARAFKHAHLGAEHLLLGILREEGAPQRYLRDRGLDLQQMRERIRAVVPDGTEPSREISMTPRVQHVLGIARGLAIGRQQNRATPEHLLLALFEDSEGIPVHLLEEIGITRSDITAAFGDGSSRSAPGT